VTQTSAEKMRRWRARERAGIAGPARRVRIGDLDALADFLADHGYPPRDDTEDEIIRKFETAIAVWTRR
jgi:hypothetical protein